ncbi:MAG: hypothetical protein Q9219_006934 [cf. Caloplaca sp. 3 TL-2023]
MRLHRELLVRAKGKLGANLLSAIFPLSSGTLSVGMVAMISVELFFGCLLVLYCVDFVKGRYGKDELDKKNRPDMKDEPVESENGQPEMEELLDLYSEEALAHYGFSVQREVEVRKGRGAKVTEGRPIHKRWYF